MQRVEAAGRAALHGLREAEAEMRAGERKRVLGGRGDGRTVPETHQPVWGEGRGGGGWREEDGEVGKAHCVLWNGLFLVCTEK